MPLFLYFSLVLVPLFVFISFLLVTIVCSCVHGSHSWFQVFFLLLCSLLIEAESLAEPRAPQFHLVLLASLSWGSPVSVYNTWDYRSHYLCLVSGNLSSSHHTYVAFTLSTEPFPLLFGLQLLFKFHLLSILGIVEVWIGLVIYWQVPQQVVLVHEEQYF